MFIYAKKRGRKGVLTPEIMEDLLTARENGLNQVTVLFMLV